MNTQNSIIEESSEPEPPSSKQGGFLSWLKNLLTARSSDPSLKESLEEVMEELESEDDSLGEEERSIIKNTLTFGDKRVDDVMVPRTDILAVEDSSPFEDVLNVFVEGTVSRLPVYRESLDEVIAMVHIKDALRVYVEAQKNGQKLSLKSVQRPILFVPPAMKLMDLLTKMQATHIHMALVVDEYGGTDGLLTIEDLVEQIVGDIEDEHDAASVELLAELPSGALRGDARLPIEDLEALLGIDLLSDDQDEDVDSLGGLVFTIAGHIPEVGETITHKSGIRFEIQEGDARSIKTILVHRIQPENIPHEDG